MINFEEFDLESVAPNPASGGRFEKMKLVQRIDPLFGNSCRIVSGAKLQPDQAPNLESLVTRSGFCPFCSDTVEKVTFPFPPEIVPTGRITLGSCWVVPNILAYSTHSAVGIYDTSRHFLKLADFTVEILRDAFSAMLLHGTAVRNSDTRIRYSSINANYLPSSGSSLIHPHLQSSHDFVALASQRQMAASLARYRSESGSSFFGDLLAQETEGPRWVAKVGPFGFLIPFAPSGFHEVWAVHESKSDVADLDDDDVSGLCLGISTILRYFDAKHLSAFNFSLQGLPVQDGVQDSRVLFRITTRSPVEPYYRSDVTYFERLCSEAMIDYLPEEFASELAVRFETNS